MKNTLATGLAFSCGNNHSRIWYGNTDTGNNFGESIIVDSVVKRICVDIVCMAETRNTDSMRTYSENCFQMFRVHQKTCQFIAVFVQTEENADANIINAALHRPVHSGCVIVIVMFWSGRVQLQITFLVVSFLKENVSADSGFFQFAVIFHCSCGNIYIDTADCTVFMFYAVNGFNGFKYIFNRRIHRVFTCLQSKAFVSHILKGNHFFSDFFLCQFLSRNMFIFHMIRAVCTAVYAIVRKVKRGKHNDTVSIEILFDLLSKSINFLIFFFNIAV